VYFCVFSIDSYLYTSVHTQAANTTIKSKTRNSSHSLPPQPNQLTLIVPNREHEIQPSVHQRSPTQRPIKHITSIPRSSLQSLDFKRRRRRLDRCLLLVSQDERLVSLFADELHRRPVGVVRQAQAVEVAVDDEGVHLGPVGQDAGDGGCFFGGEVGGPEFEAEGATLFCG
jgi:hypothetical protein